MYKAGCALFLAVTLIGADRAVAAHSGPPSRKKAARLAAAEERKKRCAASSVPPSGTCALGPDHTMLDLTWRRLDDNGLPATPIWKVQDPGEPGKMCAVDIDNPSTCGGFPVKRRFFFFKRSSPDGVPQCTTGQTRLDKIGFQDLAHILLGWVSYGGPIKACRNHPLDAILGHINWLPISYEGWVSFDSWGGPDQDATFALEPADGVSVKTSRQASSISPDLGLSGAPLHVEIHGPESFDHFGKGFAEFIADDQATRRELVTRRPAVATGLLGLDLDHEIYAELHPLYSLAWQARCAAGDSRQKWYVFFTNAADEGWVSNGRMHYLALPTPSFRVALPTRLALAPTGSRAEFFTNLGDGAVGYSLQYRNGAPLLAFRWTAAAGTPVRIHGTIEFAWPDGTPGVCTSPPAPPMENALVRAPAPTGEPPDVENRVKEILTHGTPAKGARMRSTMVEVSTAPDGTAVRALPENEVPGAPVGAPDGPGLCPAVGACDGLKAVVQDAYISVPEGPQVRAGRARAPFDPSLARVRELCAEVSKIERRTATEDDVNRWCRSHLR